MPVAPPPATSGGANAGATAPQTFTVVAQNFSFAPGTLTVKQGGMVIFTNKDSAPHTVTADDAAFGSGTLQLGQSFNLDTKTLAKGSYSYHCAIHPSMTATLTVQ